MTTQSFASAVAGVTVSATVDDNNVWTWGNGGSGGPWTLSQATEFFSTLTPEGYEVPVRTNPQIPPEQQAQSVYNTAIASGVQIISASTPAISGTYSIDAQSISNIEAQQLSILTRNLFTNGQTTRNWIDTSGVPHTFPSTAVFTVWAEAVGFYVDQLQTALATALAGGEWTPPANPVNIT